MKHRWKLFTALTIVTLFTFTIIIAAFPVFPKTVLYLRRYQHKYRAAAKLLDPLYQLTAIFMPDKLPTYSLTVSASDVQTLLRALPSNPAEKLTPDHKLKVSTKLFYSGQQITGQIAVRGELAANWWYPKKSFKLTLDQPLSLGNTAFNFILPEERGYIDEAASLILGREMNLVVPQFHYAWLNINGQNQGVYFVVEDFTPEFLSRLNLGPQLTLYAEDRFDLTASLYSPQGRWKILATTTQPTLEPIDQLKQVYALKDDQQFFDQIAQIFDMEPLLSWNALSVILGDKHQEDFHNNRLLFNHQTGKSLFIPNDVQIRLPPAIDFDSQYATDNSLVIRILKNPLWLEMRNQIILDTINSGKVNQLISELKLLEQALRPAIFADTRKYSATFTYIWDIRYKLDFLTKNLSYLQQELSAHPNSLL